MDEAPRYNEKIAAFLRKFSHIDWLMMLSIVPLLGAGLVTMNSFLLENYYFEKQLLSILFSIAVFFILCFVDFRFLRRTIVIVIFYVITCAVLILLLLFAPSVKGAQSWFNFGFFSFQPSDMAKLMLLFLLAKYFTRRHIAIANIRHILVSGTYTLVLFVLVFLQPDFGSAIIIFLIWLGVVLLAGISFRHLALVFLLAALTFGFFWYFVFQDYQKDRIISFIYPRTDISGSGYNAFQSTIAIGSGQIMGKGVGFGTQSRLKFLPEYQTDFVFSAFAEEWGFVGATIIFLCYGFFIYRLLVNSVKGETNFEILYALGLAVYFISHFVINVGMSIGYLPITGTPMPFMSYGGTHLLTEFTGLAVLMSMRRYRVRIHKEDMKKEFLGI